MSRLYFLFCFFLSMQSSKAISFNFKARVFGFALCMTTSYYLVSSILKDKTNNLDKVRSQRNSVNLSDVKNKVKGKDEDNMVEKKDSNLGLFNPQRCLIL